MSDSATAWTAALQASLSFTNSRSLLKLMSIELVMPSNRLLLYHPLLLLPCLSQQQGLFWWVSRAQHSTDWHKLCHQWMLNRLITWYHVSFLAISLSVWAVLLTLVRAAVCGQSTWVPVVCWALHWGCSEGIKWQSVVPVLRMFGWLWNASVVWHGGFLSCTKWFYWVIMKMIPFLLITVCY